MANDILELRNILFDTLRELRNKETKVDIERVMQTNAVAQTIIQSAKVEVDHMRVTGQASSTNFIGDSAQQSLVPPPPENHGFAQQLVNANVQRHICK